MTDDVKPKKVICPHCDHDAFLDDAWLPGVGMDSLLRRYTCGNQFCNKDTYQRRWVQPKPQPTLDL